MGNNMAISFSSSFFQIPFLYLHGNSLNQRDLSEFIERGYNIIFNGGCNSYLVY